MAEYIEREALRLHIKDLFTWRTDAMPHGAQAEVMAGGTGKSI